MAAIGSVPAVMNLPRTVAHTAAPNTSRAFGTSAPALPNRAPIATQNLANPGHGGDTFPLRGSPWPNQPPPVNENWQTNLWNNINNIPRGIPWNNTQGLTQNSDNRYNAPNRWDQHSLAIGVVLPKVRRRKDDEDDRNQVSPPNNTMSPEAYDALMRAREDAIRRMQAASRNRQQYVPNYPQPTQSVPTQYDTNVGTVSQESEPAHPFSASDYMDYVHVYPTPFLGLDSLNGVPRVPYALPEGGSEPGSGSSGTAGSGTG